MPQARVDDAVRRVLRVKFRLGLFDKPDADPDKAAAKQMVTPEARAAARKVAAESLILLKNDRALLPLKPVASASPSSAPWPTSPATTWAPGAPPAGARTR